ncbi:MAG TPA: marine proteobacterial sortase target protein [Candidatus Binatia bacterium]|nr:marine proteobacterial sortase target protein [Candidatus Binatia bacterium]
MTRAAIILAIGLFTVAPASIAGAAGSPGPRITEGALMFRTAPDAAPTPAPVQSTDVEMRVTGPVVRATVRQTFTNPATEWAEGVYVFPLPETAAVDHLAMHVGDRIIEGRIQEKTAAKAVYEQARAQGQRAGLVEQERPNIFTTSVANIPPGAAIAVEIQYQQTVAYDAGRFHVRFPMVVGPRFIPPPAEDCGGNDEEGDGDAARITPPVQHPKDGPLNPVTLRITLDPGLPVTGIESPYHPIHVTPIGGEAYAIALADDVVPADRDFELTWRPVEGAAPAAVLLTEPQGPDLYALLMVVPPAPATGSQARVPREVIFVLDNSGSMHGASIEQARAALKLALARLGPGDTFNVIRFNHTTSSLFLEAREASRVNLAAAARWVDAIRADGGTVMLPALRQALEGVGAPGRLRQVIFLTDGAVGNEAQLFTEIRAKLGESRLFTIGIGSAPNSHFMREAARLGRGTFTYIGSPTEVQDRMTALFRKLETPALADVRLELPGLATAEALPSPIPDLYLGEPIVVSLKAATLPSRAVLRGRLGMTPWEHDVTLHQADAGAGLAVQWARAKIDALLDPRAAGVSEEEVRTAVIDVALRHHLVSRYTSLVAVDVTPVRPAEAGLQSHALKTNLPHGWDYEAVMGLGQGATDAPLHLMLGLLALLLAAAVGVARSRPPALARWMRRAR